MGSLDELGFLGVRVPVQRAKHDGDGEEWLGQMFVSKATTEAGGKGTDTRLEVASVLTVVTFRGVARPAYCSYAGCARAERALCSAGGQGFLRIVACGARASSGFAVVPSSWPSWLSSVNVQPGQCWWLRLGLGGGFGPAHGGSNQKATTEDCDGDSQGVKGRSRRRRWICSST